MKKANPQTAKKTRTKRSVATARKTAVSTARKKTAMTKDGHYTYDTPVSVIAEKYDLKIDVSPDMKLGDFFKVKGYPVLSRMLSGES